jgi:hypothetical protein
MQLDQNPFFRKQITSWYDSNFACWTIMVEKFQEYIGFPTFLSVLCLFLVLKIALRIKRRSKNG